MIQRNGLSRRTRTWRRTSSTNALSNRRRPSPNTVETRPRDAAPNLRQAESPWASGPIRTRNHETIRYRMPARQMKSEAWSAILNTIGLLAGR